MRDAIAIIKEFEGLRLQAYVPPEGTGKGYAIGFGYTRPWVTATCVISEAWATALLQEEIDIVLNSFKTALSAGSMARLNQNQLQALVSFVYNIGISKFKASTLCKKINAKDFDGAADEFSKWKLADGKELSGLVRRRAAERDLFKKPIGG